MHPISSQPIDHDRARVSLVSPTALELEFGGYVHGSAYERVLAEVDALFAAHPGAQCLLWNVLDLTGYDPGNTAFSIRWLVRQTQVRRCAVLTRSRTIASLVNVGRVMIPALEAQAFHGRAEALAWLDTPLLGRPRSRGPRRPVA